MTGPPQTLAFVAYHWGDSYLLSSVRGRWVALRRDARYFLVADSLTEFQTLITADYQANPVDSDYDPPGEASCLAFPGIVIGAEPHVDRPHPHETVSHSSAVACALSRP